MNIAISSARFNAAGTHVPLADENDRLRAEALVLRRKIEELENMLFGRGIRVPLDWRLTRSETVILTTLYQGGADHVPTSDLIAALRSIGGTTRSPDCVAVHVWRIRRKLPEGCGVERIPNGYRLNVNAIAWLYVFQKVGS